MKRWILLPLLWLATGALADDQTAVRRAVEEGRLRPLTEIIALVQARYPGRVVDVDLERRGGGRYVYEIEILDEHRRKHEIKVDGASGTVLESEAEGVDASHFHALPVLLDRVLARHPGHVIDAEFEHGLYRIEVVRADGTHVQASVDPVDGSIVREDERNAHFGRMLPMARVLEALLLRYPGTVLEGELERGSDGDYYYEFEIQSQDEETVTLHVDALSGEVLREEED
ncbi:PepSY domain-containing protein [Xanthomonadaceae bacterium JHOS43]|nr:PepSY domain-containing protein [Xanthomonadaceae bacterium JHOS43]